MRKRYIFLIMILSLIVLSIFSCKKAPLFAFADDTLVISVNKSILMVGGERAKISIFGYRATGEVLHDHTTVFITTTFGTIDPIEIEMMNGKGEVEFFSKNIVGDTEIKARSGSIISEAITITVITDVLTKIYISADPSNFSHGGGRSKIRATAVDEAGNPMKDISIVLSATTGSFYSNKSVYITNSEGVVEDYLDVDISSQIKAESGGITSDVLDITVADKTQPPAAAFTHSPSSPKKDERVYFNGSLSTDSDGYIVSWEWDFGDGTTGRGERANHIFTWVETGSKSFNVVLKVRDNNGAVHSINKDIPIEDVDQNIDPVSDFTYTPASPKKDDAINFNGSISSDSDGNIETWTWDFGDGTTGSGEIVNHTYTWSGVVNKTYNVILTVTDNNGATHSSTQSILVTAL